MIIFYNKTIIASAIHIYDQYFLVDNQIEISSLL